MNTRPRGRTREFRLALADPAGWIPFAAIAGLLLAELAAILMLNTGHFVYSLDDPYIHLSLAENIADGHYGINLSEPAAPSSSILWPILLVPFAGTAFHDEWPLVINVLSLLGSVGVLRAIIRRAIPIGSMPFRWLPPLIVAFAAIGFNLVGLVFTGMEHSLQVFLALLLVLGLITESEEWRVRWFLTAAIVLGPLVRYENLGLSCGAVVYLGLRGRPVLALTLGALTALPLAAFSLFLRNLGLGWLPSSVIVKLKVASVDATVLDFTSALGGIFLWGEGTYSRMILLGFLMLFVWRARPRYRTSGERSLAIAGAVMATAHLVSGKYGWLGRYEVYVMISTSVLLLYVWRDYLHDHVARVTELRVGAEAALTALLLCVPTLGATVLTPLAASNTYEQQYQMHRLIAEFLAGEPVAVNDLGWTSFRNDAYVLDLWGLGSAEARALRLAGLPGWMDDLVIRHGVRFVMLYDGWFTGQIPNRWQRLGVLHLGHMRVSAAYATVTFYATDPAAGAELAKLLERFGSTLPPGVRLEMGRSG